MLKQTITYKDCNDNTRTEDFWFNLSKAEIAELQFGVEGGLGEYMRRIVSAQDIPAIIKLIKELIGKAYGMPSADGRRFVKSKELTEEFFQTEAYSQLFIEISTNAEAAAKFVSGIIPAEIAKQIDIEEAKSLISPIN